MKPRTIEDLQARFRQLGHVWPKGVHTIGIRNLNHQTNTFDDVLICVKDSKIVVAGIGTTVPGSYYLLNILNPAGAGILKCAQYVDAYALGLHQGKYMALKQVKPVTVFRDKDKDLLPEEIAGTEQTGMFGVNQHHASISKISKFIDNWSAACQVWDNILDFNLMLKTCVDSKQPFFTYTLLKDW